MGKFGGIKPRENIETHANKEDELLALKSKAAAHKKGGRPKKSEEEALNKKVVLLLTNKEFETLKAKSAEAGIPVATFAKAAVKKEVGL
jgi:hypothetical protein